MFEQLNIFSPTIENKKPMSPENKDHLENIIKRMNRSFFSKKDPNALNRAITFISSSFDHQQISDEMNHAYNNSDLNYRNLLREAIVYEYENKGTLSNLFYPDERQDVLIPKGNTWEKAIVVSNITKDHLYKVKPYREGSLSFYVGLGLIKPI